MAVSACASVCAYARRQAERVIARKFKLALSKSPFSRRRALAAMHFPPRWARRALAGRARYRAQIQTGAPRVAARIQVRMCRHWIPHQNKLARRCAARNLLRVIARGFKIKLARRCAARKPAC